MEQIQSEISRLKRDPRAGVNFWEERGKIER